MPQLTFSFKSYSGNTRMLSTQTAFGTMPGQLPVPFHSFPRVKQATPVRSLYTFLFGRQTGQTGVLPHELLFRSQAGQTGTVLFRYLLGVEPTMSVYSHLNSPSAWKLNRANRYVSA